MTPFSQFAGQVDAFTLETMATIAWDEALTSDGVFLNVSSPDDQQLEALRLRFGLDELHIDDIRNPMHPPHLTACGHKTLMAILRFPIAIPNTLDEVEICSATVIVDPQACVLVWPEQKQHPFTAEDITELTVNDCFIQIIHALTDQLLVRSYSLRNTLDELEDECLDDVSNADMEALMHIRKEFSINARLTRGNLTVIEQLLKMMDYKLDVLLKDAHEHMHRALSIAEQAAEQVLNVMQTVQSLLSQHLNDVMRFLAVVTVILTPMGIIAGVFGMNFQDMKVLSIPHGFALSLWMMLLLGLSLGVLFKFKKWW